MMSIEEIIILLPEDFNHRRKGRVDVCSRSTLLCEYVQPDAEASDPAPPPFGDLFFYRLICVRENKRISLYLRFYRLIFGLGICKLSGAVVWHCSQGQKIFSACLLVIDSQESVRNLFRADSPFLRTAEIESCGEEANICSEELKSWRHRRSDDMGPRIFLSTTSSRLGGRQPNSAHQRANSADRAYPSGPLGRPKRRSVEHLHRGKASNQHNDSDDDSTGYTVDLVLRHETPESYQKEILS